MPRNCIIVVIYIGFTSNINSNEKFTRDEISKWIRKYANPNMNKQTSKKTNKQTFK